MITQLILYNRETHHLILLNGQAGAPQSSQPNGSAPTSKLKRGTHELDYHNHKQLLAETLALW